MYLFNTLQFAELRQMSNLQNQAVNAAGLEYMNAPDSDYLNTHVYLEIN